MVTRAHTDSFPPWPSCHTTRNFNLQVPRLRQPPPRQPPPAAFPPPKRRGSRALRMHGAAAHDRRRRRRGHHLGARRRVVVTSVDKEVKTRTPFPWHGNMNAPPLAFSYCWVHSLWSFAQRGTSLLSQPSPQLHQEVRPELVAQPRSHTQKSFLRSRRQFARCWWHPRVCLE